MNTRPTLEKRLLPPWLAYCLLTIVFWGLWGIQSKVILEEISPLSNRHCHVNRVGPQKPAWIPFQAAALALSHTLNASFRNRLNVSLLHK